VATDKQIAANRLNAQKSTGPRTPEGRAVVRLNGVTHGLTAQTLVLKGESESDFKQLFDSLEAEHAPATPTEEALVVQLAMATWRLRRLYHQEAGYYTCQLQSLVGMQKDLNLDDAGRMGHAAAWSESTLTLFNRQEARLERTFYRALHELQHRHNPSVSEGYEPPDMPAAQPPSDAPASPEYNLASVSQTQATAPITPSVSAGAEPPSSETNNIQQPPDPKIPTSTPEPNPPASGRPIL
jgi:hypothetical protein